MSLKVDFELMGRCNQWMDGRLCAQAANLDEVELRADRGAFFGSILATLAHILVLAAADCGVATASSNRVYA